MRCAARWCVQDLKLHENEGRSLSFEILSSLQTRKPCRKSLKKYSSPVPPTLRRSRKNAGIGIEPGFGPHQRELCAHAFPNPMSNPSPQGAPPCLTTFKTRYHVTQLYDSTKAGEARSVQCSEFRNKTAAVVFYTLFVFSLTLL